MLSNARATTPRPAIKSTKVYHYRSPVCDLGATEWSSMFLTDMACERAVDMPRAFSAAATVSIGVQILQDE
jgi:hypothetical protein